MIIQTMIKNRWKRNIINCPRLFLVIVELGCCTESFLLKKKLKWCRNLRTASWICWWVRLWLRLVWMCRMRQWCWLKMRTISDWVSCINCADELGAGSIRVFVIWWWAAMISRVNDFERLRSRKTDFIWRRLIWNCVDLARFTAKCNTGIWTWKLPHWQIRH